MNGQVALGSIYVASPWRCGARSFLSCGSESTVRSGWTVPRWNASGGKGSTLDLVPLAARDRLDGASRTAVLTVQCPLPLDSIPSRSAGWPGTETLRAEEVDEAVLQRLAGADRGRGGQVAAEVAADHVRVG